MRKLFISIFLVATFIYCNGDAHQQQTNDAFFKQLIALKEFKQEDKAMDSLKKIKGLPYSISFTIVNGFFSKEDSLKNFGTAFIEENLSPDSRITYTVKFDNAKKKIIQVKKENKGYAEQ